jgi:hypothetical protein
MITTKIVKSDYGEIQLIGFKPFELPKLMPGFHLVALGLCHLYIISYFTFEFILSTVKRSCCR